MWQAWQRGEGLLSGPLTISTASPKRRGFSCSSMHRASCSRPCSWQNRCGMASPFPGPVEVEEFVASDGEGRNNRDRLVHRQQEQLRVRVAARRVRPEGGPDVAMQIVVIE